MSNAAEEDWRVLVSLFPQGWQQQATQTGAIERQRGITSPETLLRLFLLHVARGYSLRETVVRAKEGGLTAISDVGLMKRLRRSEEWLRWLCTQLVAENGVRMPSEQRPRSVRIVDGTIIREPGKTGSQWRIVYSMRLPDLRCDYFDLSATKGAGTGESLMRVPAANGDLILADAGYCSAPSIESVVDEGGDVLVRINPQNFRALNKRGRRFDLLSHVGKLHTAGEIGQWPVKLAGTAVRGNVCAVRKERRGHSANSPPYPASGEQKADGNETGNLGICQVCGGVHHRSAHPDRDHLGVVSSEMADRADVQTAQELGTTRPLAEIR